MTSITHADDPVSFDREVLQSEIPVVVDFWADWCGPCHMVAPELEELADLHQGTVKVVKVDVDANQSVADRYGIRGIPTVLLFEAGRPVASSVGAKRRPAIEAELGIVA